MRFRHQPSSCRLLQTSERLVKMHTKRQGYHKHFEGMCSSSTLLINRERGSTKVCMEF